MPSLDDEIVLKIFSRYPWDRVDVWEKVFSLFQRVLDGLPVKLDTRDPPRRKFKDFSLEENAAYLCDFGAGESSRTVFGSYPKHLCSFSVSLYRDAPDFNHSLSIYLPRSAAEQAEALFNALIESLSPFYAYADYQSTIAGKRRADHFAVSFDQELVGVFWLTWFCSTYVRHFGASVFDSLNTSKRAGDGGGVTLKLSDSPGDVPPELRQHIEEVLGKDAFVDPTSTKLKPVGKFVPSYDQF